MHQLEPGSKQSLVDQDGEASMKKTESVPNKHFNVSVDKNHL
jgi:hypothetical protein